jgi:FXSXX-COOH protein
VADAIELDRQVAMRSTDEAARVASVLPDVRDVPLTQMSVPNAIWRDAALARVLPDSPVAPVPVAAFQSAI